MSLQLVERAKLPPIQHPLLSLSRFILELLHITYHWGHRTIDELWMKFMVFNLSHKTRQAKNLVLFKISAFSIKMNRERRKNLVETPKGPK